MLAPEIRLVAKDLSQCYQYRMQIRTNSKGSESPLATSTVPTAYYLQEDPEKDYSPAKTLLKTAKFVLSELSSDIVP